MSHAALGQSSRGTSQPWYTTPTRVLLRQSAWPLIIYNRICMCMYVSRPPVCAFCQSVRVFGIYGQLFARISCICLASQRWRNLATPCHLWFHRSSVWALFIRRVSHVVLMLISFLQASPPLTILSHRVYVLIWTLQTLMYVCTYVNAYMGWLLFLIKTISLY